MSRVVLILTFLFILSNVFSQDEEKFIMAAANGDVGKVQSMIKKGVNLNAKNKTRWTALAYAAKYNKLEVVKLLVESGVDVNQKVNTGETSLQIALKSDNFEIAEYLVTKKADVDVKDILGMSALAWACKDGNTRIVKFLINNGANVNSKNNNGLTILDATTNSEIKSMLRAKGAKTNEEIFKENTEQF